MTKNPNPEEKTFFCVCVCVCVGGGGGGGGGEGGRVNEHKSHHIFLYKTYTISSTELYSLMKIFVTVFKMEGIVALTIKGRQLRKHKGESCHSCARHIIKTCWS